MNREGREKNMQFIIGLILGGFIGVVLMCLVQVSKEEEDLK
jgi:uncharacterized membrane protein YccC